MNEVHVENIIKFKALRSMKNDLFQTSHITFHIYVALFKKL